MLVVDDLAEAREVLVNILQHMGVEVDTAQSGEAALTPRAARRARGERYDVALIDWLMEPMDGLETRADCARSGPSRLPRRAGDRVRRSATSCAFLRKPGCETVLQKPVRRPRSTTR
ncbi:MAG: response regulator [Comamonadaceae bacterium]|nr:response regulator [Comamonadaceae bacterium]